MQQFKRWSEREYSLASRILVSLLGGVLFAFLIPYTLLKLGPRLDLTLGLPSLFAGPVNWVAGGILAAIGIYYAFTSIGSQLFDARGTPIPAMATHKLLVTGVFRQSRNPMSFGSICLYLGLAILAGSLTSLAIVIIFTALLMTYIKKIEERELALRFGAEYEAYKASTPFILPRIFPRRKL